MTPSKSVRTASLLVIMMAVSAKAQCGTEDEINCRHGSTCAEGTANYDMFQEMNPDLPFLANTDIDGMYCECNDFKNGIGHTGVRCEIKFSYCDGDSDLICFNSAPCVGVDDDEGEYFCDCTEAKKEGNHAFFAGVQCEYEATSVCEYDDEADLKGEENNKWFCTNGGRCRNSEDINKRCKCKDGFEGPHCEYKVGKAPSQDDCDLNCKHGGQCTFGAKDYGNHEDYDVPFVSEIHSEGKHCICKDGWTGLFCETKLEPCGNHYCYNGAKCLENKGNLGGSTYHCDCSSLSAEDKAYAGKYCEAEATSFCPYIKDQKPNVNICVNGGTCNPQAHGECLCPEGYKGDKCEIPVTEEAPSCDLDCKNGGKCRSGVKQYTDKLGSSLPFMDHVNFQHCACPDGYTGLDCSVEMKFCGDDEHVCVHGSTCVQTGVDDNGQDTWGCDCAQASSENEAYAGKFCEHKTTVFCSKSDSGFEGHTFCVNGGQCAEEITATEAHPACLCDDGYEGDHCEYKKGEKPANKVSSRAQSQSSGGGGGGAGAGFILLILLIVASVGAVAILIIQRKRRNDRVEKEIIAADSNIAPAAGVDSDPKAEMTEDGEKLENVEII